MLQNSLTVLQRNKPNLNMTAGSFVIHCHLEDFFKTTQLKQKCIQFSSMVIYISK